MSSLYVKFLILTGAPRLVDRFTTESHTIHGNPFVVDLGSMGAIAVGLQPSNTETKAPRTADRAIAFFIKI